MSEVTTLKQLMLDAARYRWVRDNLHKLEEMACIPDERSLAHGELIGRYLSPAECDTAIDAELDRG